MTATATLVQSLRDAATYADCQNDGYDQHASGCHSGFSIAASQVEKQGASQDLAGQLRSQAGVAVHSNDYAGFDDYSPFYVGQASSLLAAAAIIEKAV